MAKQPKKLTRKQKELLTKKGFQATDWMLVTEDDAAYFMVHKKTGEKMWVEKKK